MVTNVVLPTRTDEVDKRYTERRYLFLYFSYFSLIFLFSFIIYIIYLWYPEGILIA